MRKLATATGYSVLAGVTGRFVFSLGSILFARILGAEEYGVYVNMLAFVNALSVVALFGIHTAFSVFVPQYVQEHPQRLSALIMAGHTIIGTLTAIIAALVVSLAPFISHHAYDSHISASTLQISLLLLIGLVANTASMAVLYGFQDFRRYAVLSVVSSVGIIFCALAGSVVYGVMGIIVGSGAGYLGTALAAFIIIRRHTALRFTAAPGQFRDTLRSILRFSVPAFLSGVFVAPAYWIGNFLITQSGDTSNSGYFGVANALAQLVLLVPSLLAAPLIPILSEVHVQGDERRFSSLVLKNLRMVWLVTLPFVAVAGIAASPIITLLYGHVYAPAIPTFLVLLGANTLIAVEGVLGNVLIARKKMWDSFTANLLWFLSFLFFVLLLLRNGGHWEFAISLLCAYSVFGIVIMIFLQRHVTMVHALSTIAPLLLLTLVVFTVVWMLAGSPVSAWGKVGLAGGLAALLCLIEWRHLLTDDERGAFRELIHEYWNRRTGR